MTRILLVDDSPHAQRMGDRILGDEGYEVVTVSNADSALIRLDDVDPDVVVADAVMPGRTGYDICQFLKMSPRHRHVRVILTAGVLEPLDEDRVRQVEADATLKKPFEATGLLAAVKPLAEAAAAARAAGSSGAGAQAAAAATPREQAPFIAVVDAEQVRAAVTVALDASMEAMVEEISRRVMLALQSRKPDPERTAPSMQPPRADLGLPHLPLPAVQEQAQFAPPAPAVPAANPVRRVTPLRLRSGSVLGLDPGRAGTGLDRPGHPAGSQLPPFPPLASELPVTPGAAPAGGSETASSAAAIPMERAGSLGGPQLPPLPPLAPETGSAPAPSDKPAAPGEPKAVLETAKAPRVSLLRPRPGSILGLDTYTTDSEEPPPPRS